MGKSQEIGYLDPEANVLHFSLHSSFVSLSFLLSHQTISWLVLTFYLKLQTSSYSSFVSIPYINQGGDGCSFGNSALSAGGGGGYYGGGGGYVLYYMIIKWFLSLCRIIYEQSIGNFKTFLDVVSMAYFYMPSSSMMSTSPWSFIFCIILQFCHSFSWCGRWRWRWCQLWGILSYWILLHWEW